MLGDASLLVARGDHAFVLLNKFPYSFRPRDGAPLRHVGELGALEPDEAAEIHVLTTTSLEILRGVYGPDAFNVGWNLGHVQAGRSPGASTSTSSAGQGNTTSCRSSRTSRSCPSTCTQRACASARPGPPRAAFLAEIRKPCHRGPAGGRGGLEVVELQAFTVPSSSAASSKARSSSAVIRFVTPPAAWTATVRGDRRSRSSRSEQGDVAVGRVVALEAAAEGTSIGGRTRRPGTICAGSRAPPSVAARAHGCGYVIAATGRRARLRGRTCASRSSRRVVRLLHVFGFRSDSTSARCRRSRPPAAC